MNKNYSKNTFKVVRSILSPLMKVTFRPQVVGVENLPKEGPFILAGNHQSILDIPLVATTTKKEIHFIAKDELFKTKLGNYLMHKLGAISIKRDKIDLEAIHKSLGILKNSEILGIFPEGTRSKDGTLQPFKSGTPMLSIKADCPIIPFGISGEYKIGKKIKIQFGEAIKFKKEDIKKGEADQTLYNQVKQLLKKKSLPM